MKKYLGYFVGAICVMVGIKAGSWVGDQASKGIDRLVDAICKKKTEEPAGEAAAE